MLEATKDRQAREIKDLRRKLREMRHVPSRPLYANPESMSPTTSDISLPKEHSNSSHSSDEEDELEPDPAFERIQKLIEGLLAQAHRAIERTIDDCMPAPTNTVKVFNAEEFKRYERKKQGLPEPEGPQEGQNEDEDISIDDDNGNSQHKDALESLAQEERRPSIFHSPSKRPSTLWAPD
jgi:hypothetical protein